MNKIFLLAIGILFLFITGCRYENAVDLYYQGGDIKQVSKNGLLAHIPFDKSVKDISDNKVPVALQGNPVYVKGVNGKDSSAIYLNGYPQCVTIGNLGINDSISIFLWFKTDNTLAKTDSFTIFDYGVKSFALQIDGSTGATLISTIKDNQRNTISDYANSYTIWNYLYAQAVGGKIKVVYQGSLKDKTLINIDSEKDSPGVLSPLTDIIYIGRPASGAITKNSCFKGSIDNIRIYNRSLSKAEILSLVNEDKTN